MSGNSERGLNFNGHRIPDTRLLKIWNTFFSNKPFPQVKAYLMRDRDFHKFLEKLLRDGLVINYGLREWGDNSIKFTTAVCFDTVNGPLILVKQGSQYPLDEDLKHELQHIFRGHHKTGP